VHVYGVPAYSTLGWFNWLGGDPLLNTFIRWSEPELAGLVFHELAHQLLYVQDDTAFNESFATAVQRLGTQQWLTTQASPRCRPPLRRPNCAARVARTDAQHPPPWRNSMPNTPAPLVGRHTCGTQAGGAGGLSPALRPAAGRLATGMAGRAGPARRCGTGRGHAHRSGH
jgi:hypothetical protein